jgi:tetratricopeptide (TPR) repeat protein
MFSISRFIAVIIFFFIFSVSFSQNNKTLDSLKVIVKTAANDTIKVIAITQIQALVNQNEDESQYYLDETKRLADKNLKRKSLSKRENLVWQNIRACYYAQKGKFIFETDQKTGMGYIDDAIRIFASIGQTQKVAEIYINKGKLLKRMGRAPEAVVCYFKGLKCYEKLKDAAGVAYVQMNVGKIYTDQKKYREAIKLHQQALDYFKSIKNPTIDDNQLTTELWRSIGKIYFTQGKYDKAESYYSEGLKLAKKINYTTLISQILESSGRVSFQKGQYDIALQKYREALTGKLPELYKANVYVSLGQLYMAQKECALAEKFLTDGLDIAIKGKELTIQMYAVKYLDELYRKTANFEKALSMFERYRVLQDTLKIGESRNTLKEQQLKYEFEKKELQQEILQQNKLAAIKLEQEKKVSAIRLDAEKKSIFQTSKSKLAQQQLLYDFDKKALRQKIEQGKKVSAIKLDSEKKTAVKNNWLIGLSGILLLLLLGVYFYHRNNKQKQAITLLEKDQIKQKLLVTQMNPHFIFNSIHNIQDLIYDKKNDEAVNYLDKFSALTRQILENSNENYISLTEEVAMIKNYMAIQQLLHSNKFNYTISVEDKIDPETIFLPPMLTQPFIENAIKHGLSNIKQNGMIAIHFYLTSDKLFFEVSDNGKGFDAIKKSTDHKSLAMTITKERLIGYSKNQNFVVHTDNISDKDNKIVGAKVRFEIPYIYEN